MRTRPLFFGAFLLSLLLLSCGAAQNSMNTVDRGNPTIMYDPVEDRTTVVYEDGSRFTADGELDRHDVERIERTLAEVEEDLEQISGIEIDLSGIEESLQDIEIDFGEVESFAEEFGRFGTDIEVSLKNDLLFDPEEFSIEIDCTELEESMKKLERSLNKLKMHKYYTPEPDIHEDVLQDLHALRFIMPEIAMHFDGLPRSEKMLRFRYNDRFVPLSDWDKSAVQHSSKRKIFK